jgi:hypothetical protein
MAASKWLHGEEVTCQYTGFIPMFLLFLSFCRRWTQMVLIVNNIAVWKKM